MAQPHPPLQCLPVPSARFRSTLPLRPKYQDHPHFVCQIYGASITPKFYMRYAEKRFGRPKGSIEDFWDAHIMLAMEDPIPGIVVLNARRKVGTRGSDDVWTEVITERFVPIIPFNGDWEHEDVGAENAEGSQALTAEEVEDRIKKKTRDMMGLRGLLWFRWFNLYELGSKKDDVDDPDARWENNLR
ncbi:hypothetical protein NLJ89_g1374 [Agrocybe chaxingu]|uniref:Uncharacterized protein n=1 Tax=Agrocybe chaxingu TaxID=84603 RepID=A0A9W8TDJ0_9AGAR|nr:hypothetical protein NLJ89_g1374 [Agrocybe chaxingu]